ncbi:hypothetical protein J437_LFUL011572 [Ladona fulva]|uniref:Uncharacterized protein n=1 Tax=Ladona fulva TaxID=123851 RepID=A0A8K0P2U5_LADFU|nr:hypothetical protein J437_LFUL011572 [Ladona fulva]
MPMMASAQTGAALTVIPKSRNKLETSDWRNVLKFCWYQNSSRLIFTAGKLPALKIGPRVTLVRRMVKADTRDRTDLPESRAYQKPRSTAVQVARIAGITLVAASAILGTFLLAAAWINTRYSCQHVVVPMPISHPQTKLNRINSVNSAFVGQFTGQPYDKSVSLPMKI